MNDGSAVERIFAYNRLTLLSQLGLDTMQEKASEVGIGVLGGAMVLEFAVEVGAPLSTAGVNAQQYMSAGFCGGFAAGTGFWVIVLLAMEMYTRRQNIMNHFGDGLAMGV